MLSDPDIYRAADLLLDQHGLSERTDCFGPAGMSDRAVPRKGMPSPRLGRAAFRARYLAQFQDPAFELLRGELAKIEAVAWDAYADSRKSRHTIKAGHGFADPDYDLSVDWLAARDAIAQAQRQHDDPKQPLRALLINASPRSEHTCPGEMSKSWRLVELARRALIRRRITVDLLDLSRVTSEYGRHIHPCKACFSTSPALCHWPCSCYPNHSLGQVQDWMNKIYPLWVAAHGIMIVTPVHWYQATSPLKLMIDRLVCADGGNPDPTSTQGKKARLAKEIELKDWDYPRRLAGRFFALAVHGDTEGAEGLRRALSDWLISMELRPAGRRASFDRYIGYWEDYSTSHQALDRDHAIQREVRNAALSLAGALKLDRAGKHKEPASPPEPRMK